MNEMHTALRQESGYAPGKTRYVFAAREEPSSERGTKVCPRCGQVLFEDMDICYGCLYDFSHNERFAYQQQPPVPRKAARRQTPRPVHDPLTSIELDEIDDDVEPAPPRHRKVRASAVEDTLDLSALEVPAVVALPERAEVPAEASSELGVLVETNDVCLWTALPREGLVVGRNPTSDVVLYARTVSRSHMRLVPQKDHVLVQDLGATNPALSADGPIEGTIELAVGEQVEVCGCTFTAAVRRGQLTAREGDSSLKPLTTSREGGEGFLQPTWGNESELEGDERSS